ncbi:hypothetical protein [Sphingomonas sp. 28-63-12]|uniref:hypothetical protein n=1 Tax=Sphingomonas sp. 28-63-12 TaxID=1970434 RepID=UPI000BC9C690|nr:MAG: hypothetical protein B7Y47_00275 [Sphingomonas sp. 28-63-12]
MAKRGQSLDRILRVRTLQLGLVRAAEVQAQEKLASEDALRLRIAQLAENVAPQQSAAEAFSFIAAAHFRDRLSQSAAAADGRMAVATRNLERASEATREARRDQSAVEKLIARDDQAAVVKAMRALEETPPARKNRHGPC